MITAFVKLGEFPIDYPIHLGRDVSLSDETCTKILRLIRDEVKRMPGVLAFDFTLSVKITDPINVKGAKQCPKRTNHVKSLNSTKVNPNPPAEPRCSKS